eukprot:jgi/Bigna1/66421/fgenesh1_pg.1_\
MLKEMQMSSTRSTDDKNMLDNSQCGSNDTGDTKRGTTAERERENTPPREDSPPRENALPNRSSSSPPCSSPWIMLGLYCILAIMDHVIWVSFWPIVREGQVFFGVGRVAIFMLSMIYVVMFIVCAPLAGQAVDQNGLRYGILMGSFLNFLGSLIKVIPAPFSMNGITGYVFNFAGNVVGGIAHSFILIIPPTLAQNWFDSKHRVTCQAISIICYEIGVTVGILVIPKIGSSDNVSLLLLMLFMGSLFVYIIELIFFVGKPPTRPSLSSVTTSSRANRRSTSCCSKFLRAYSFSELTKTTYALSRTNGYLLTLLSFGVATGVQNAIWVVLGVNTIMSTTEFLSANVLLIYTFVGVLGALFSAWAIDCGRFTHRATALYAYLGFAASLLLFSVCLAQKSLDGALFSCAVMGVFSSALTPSTFDLLMEITYPAPQAIATSLPLVVGQLWTLIFVWGNFFIQRKSFYAPALFLAVTAFVGATLYISADNTDYRRRDYERDAASGRVAAGQPSHTGLMELDTKASLQFFTLEGLDDDKNNA